MHYNLTKCSVSCIREMHLTAICDNKVAFCLFVLCLQEYLPKPNKTGKDQIQVSIVQETASGCYTDRQFQYTGRVNGVMNMLNLN